MSVAPLNNNNANGGLPSYVNVAPTEASPSPLPVSTVASSDEEPLPPGITQKEANDPTSVYSQTKATLQLPFIATTQRVQPPPPQTAPLPSFLLHCTVYAVHDARTPHPVPFQQVGCPAAYSRGLVLAKRIGVELPLPYLGNRRDTDTYAYLAHPQPKNGAEMVGRSGDVGRYRKVSLFRAQARELTGIVSRPLVERVLGSVYADVGVHGRMAIFPAEAVLRYSHKCIDATQVPTGEDDGEQKSGWLSKLKAKAKGKGKSENEQAAAGVPAEQLSPAIDPPAPAYDQVPSGIRSIESPMVYATIDLLAPPSRLLETGGPYPLEMNKASDADISVSSRLLAEFDRASVEERFQRFMFTPNGGDNQLLADMLNALERRGAVWTEAGRLIAPSSRNPRPRERARFLVKGLFPERWVLRCKYYRNRKYEPMPSDLDPKEVKKFGSPLIVHTAIERTGAEGVDLADFVAPRSGSPATGSAAEGGPRLEWEWAEEGRLITNPSQRSTTSAGGAETPRPDYITAKQEVLQGYGIESPRAKALIEAEQDFFRGWSIGYTEEPFKNGGWLEILNTQSGMYYAGGVGGL